MAHNDIEKNIPIIAGTSETGCNDYCCSAFARFMNLPIFGLETLSNTIHPIFRKQNFRGNIDYEARKPCLRLATHLLESTGLVPFLNTLVNGEVRDLDGKSQAQLHDGLLDPTRPHSIWPSFEQEEINEKTRKRARQILRQMVEMVSFEIEPFDRSSIRPHYYGRCVPLHGPLPPESPTCFPHGFLSKILLRGLEYNDLVGLTHDEIYLPIADANGQVWSLHHLLQLRFQITRTLVHEIGRAIAFAAHGSLLSFNEPCYKDGKIAEIGFELEAHLFGGVFFPNHESFRSSQSCEQARQDLQTYQLGPQFYYHSWPFFNLNGSRRNSGIDHWSYKKSSNFDLFWTVPMTFFQSLFTDAFWRAQKQRQDIHGVHPPKIVSWPFDYANGIRFPIPFNVIETT